MIAGWRGTVSAHLETFTSRLWFESSSMNPHIITRKKPNVENLQISHVGKFVFECENKDFFLQPEIDCAELTLFFGHLTPM